jgi:hypothetical protein
MSVVEVVITEKMSELPPPEEDSAPFMHLSAEPFGSDS